MILEVAEKIEIEATPQSADLSEWMIWAGGATALILLAIVAKKTGLTFKKKSKKLWSCIAITMLCLGLSACTSTAAKEGGALVKQLRKVNEDNYSYGDEGKPTPESAKASERAAIDAVDGLLKRIAGE